MFYGEYKHQIDEKGRIRIPAKFRDELGDEPMMVCGPSECIMIMSKANYDAMVKRRFEGADFVDIKLLKMQRVIFRSALKCVEDKQGRVSLSSALIDYAGIKKNLVSIGVMDRVELWAQEHYDAYMAEIDDFDTIIAEAFPSKVD